MKTITTMKLLLIAALAAADMDVGKMKALRDELSGYGTLHKDGLLSDEEFGEIKHRILAEIKGNQQDSSVAPDNSRRQLSDKNEKVAKSKCLASMVATSTKDSKEAKSVAEKCAKEVTQVTNPTVVAMYQYLVKAGQMDSGSKNEIIQHTKDLKTLRSQMTSVLVRLNKLERADKEILEKLKEDPCEIIDARGKHVGYNGRLQSSIKFSSLSSRPRLIDGNTGGSGYDAHDDIQCIRVKGKCNKCLQVYTNASSYHQLATSLTGTNWKGCAVDRTGGCSSGGWKSSGTNPKMKLSDWKTANPWTYACYGTAQGGRTVYEIKTVSC